MTASGSDMAITVVGDFCPRGVSCDVAAQGADAAIDRSLLNQFALSDLAIANVECPLTDATVQFLKTGPHLRASREWARWLRDGGFGVATLASNHIYDYGRQGLDDTVEACMAAGLATVGAGRTLADARQPLLRTINGKRLAVINIADNEFCSATRYHGGSNPLDLVANARQIQATARTADYVLVIVHGGNEYSPYPSPATVDRYRFFVENGAHAVIGHHPHVVQGYEIHEGAPIVYSVGNFFFPPKGRSSGPAWSTGMAATVSFPFTSATCLDLLPFRQCASGWRVEAFSGDESTAFRRHLDEIGSALEAGADLETLWRESLGASASALLWYLSFGSLPMQVARVALSRAGLLDRLTRVRSRTNRWRLALVKTEAHRELLVSALADRFRGED